MYYTFAETPAGTLLFIGNDKIITGVHWKVFKRTPVIAAGWREDKSVFREALQQLNEYFASQRQTFDFAYEAIGTKFQMSVWRELTKIPYGTHCSYQGIAIAVGRPKAVRAVGTAVGSNPISVVVPCHRVLTSTNKLGGYAGGLTSKMHLLQVEGIGFRE
ncbi:MAG: methylated-DNA--[protein]-cysteine S-methyltransferase [Candidatus Nitrosopolaris sp.]